MFCLVTITFDISVVYLILSAFYGMAERQLNELPILRFET